MFRKNTRFVIEAIEGNTIKVNVEGTPVNEIEREDFVVFTTDQILSAQATEDFLKKLAAMIPGKKVILLPSFIKVCEFREEIYDAKEEAVE